MHAPAVDAASEVLAHIDELPGQPYLHYRIESAQRRQEIARVISDLPFCGGLVVTQVAAPSRQEHARRLLLAWLLPHLQDVERADQIVIESRHGSDTHDRRLVRHLHQSRRIAAGLWISHVPKLGDERLWLADFVMGAYGDAELHGRPGPWEILTKSHCIDVQVDPR